jgi:hypothetical protein
VGGGDAAAAAAERADRALAGRPVGAVEARRWVEQNEVEPVGARLVSLTASPAVQPVERTRTLTAEAVAVDATADLALLRISGAAAGPSVPMDDAQTIGTPVVTIGYGGDGSPRPADDPALRRGALGRTGFVPREEQAQEGGTTVVEETATEVLGGIARGDSGGPVVDASGRLRGIVVSLGRTDGILEPSGVIRRFLREHGVTPRVALADTVFRSGMEDLWALDFAGAEQAFGRTSRLAPDHPSTPALLARTLELKEATVRLRPRDAPRHFLQALALTAAVGAIVSALALLFLARHEAARPRPEQPTPEGGAP